MRTVYVNMSKARLLRVLRGVPRAAQRSETFQRRLAEALLTKVREAFIVKSGGGTDETGERWKPLAASTVARRSREAGPRPSGGLSPAQRDRWWDYYRSALWRFKDKAIAARVAWAKLKREGAIPQYKRAGARVDILRDTEALLLSLSPRTVTPNKVQRFGLGEFTVGTRREGAGAHHRGVLGRLPQRRLWPAPRTWSSPWWKYLLYEARDGVVDVVLAEVGRA